MINLPYMGLITIRLMNAPTNHVPANPRHVHTPISDDEQPVLLVIYAGCMEQSLRFLYTNVVMWFYTSFYFGSVVILVLVCITWNALIYIPCKLRRSHVCLTAYQGSRLRNLQWDLDTSCSEIPVQTSFLRCARMSEWKLCVREKRVRTQTCVDKLCSCV